MAETEQIEITCDQDGRLRRVPLGDLHRFQGMLKTLSVGEYDKLKASIIKYGFFVPVFVWKNRILDGHQRLFVIEKEGWELAGGVPVVDIEAETETEAAEKLLILSSTYGKVEPQGLYEFTQTHDISLAEFDLPDLPDFDLESFKDEFYDEEEGDEGAADEVPDVPEVPVSQTGDLWLLGDHRLLCGDSTSGEDVARLMDGQQADMVFTDPPYGIEVVGGSKSVGGSKLVEVNKYDSIKGDESTETAKASYLLIKGCESIVIFGGNYMADFLPPSRGWIVWDKKGQDWADNFSDFEMAWTNTNTKANIYRQLWMGLIKQGEKGKRSHPTQKPIALSEWCFDKYGKPKSVLDPFLGSGSTLIACEKTDRQCYGLEIDPHYCDVIVQRWQDYTGQEATLDGDGRAFGEVAEERGPVLVAA